MNIIKWDGKPITKPGIYTLSAQDYHADPCPEPSLSGSIAIPLVHKSPMHAHHAHVRLNPNCEREENNRLSLGSAAHSMLLGAGNPVKFLDYENYKKNAAQESRDAAIASGQIPILTKEQPTLEEMVRTAREFMSACGINLDAGKPEQAMIWREQGAWCRGMVDWLSDDLLTFLDYKTTTNANPAGADRSLYGNEYHLKAAFYERGLDVLDPNRNNIGHRRALFLFQEIDPPFACSLQIPSEGGMTIGRKQITYAIQTFARCMATKQWPGYGTKITSVMPPTWIETAWLNREEADDAMTGATSPDGYVPEITNELVTGD